MSRKVVPYTIRCLECDKSTTIRDALQNRLDEIKSEDNLDDTECLLDEVADILCQYDNERLRYVTRFDPNDGLGVRRNEQLAEEGRIKFLNECVAKGYKIIELLEESLY